MADWSRILGVTDANTIDTTRKKYRKLALQRHPNKGGTTEQCRNELKMCAQNIT